MKSISVVDTVLGLHASTYAFSVDNMDLKSWVHADHCTRTEVKLGLCEPFNDEDTYGEYILTLGYIVTAAVFVPICLKDLKENSVWQIFGFGILVSLSCYFCYVFWNSGHVSLHHAGGLWGHSASNMLGEIMFNFGLVLAIPAWLNEKKPNVSVVKTVVYSTAIATVLYIGVGALAALTISHVHVNLLTPMVSGAYGEGVQIAASIFAFFIIGLDIPLFSVLTRYNLTHSGLCSTRTANLLVVWIPWGLAWIFYQGNAVGDLLSWGGTLLTSALAFILPLYLALRALQSQTDLFVGGSVPIYVSHYMIHNRAAQIAALRLLLGIAVFSVIAAIGGQLYSAGSEDMYLHSVEYFNDTDVFINQRFASFVSYNFSHRYLKGSTTALSNPYIV
jgi:hypothetical protein